MNPLVKAFYCDSTHHSILGLSARPHITRGGCEPQQCYDHAITEGVLTTEKVLW